MLQADRLGSLTDILFEVVWIMHGWYFDIDIIYQYLGILVSVYSLLFIYLAIAAWAFVNKSCCYNFGFSDSYSE